MLIHELVDRFVESLEPPDIIPAELWLNTVKPQLRQRALRLVEAHMAKRCPLPWTPDWQYCWGLWVVRDQLRARLLVRSRCRVNEPNRHEFCIVVSRPVPTNNLDFFASTPRYTEEIWLDQWFEHADQAKLVFAYTHRLLILDETTHIPRVHELLQAARQWADQRGLPLMKMEQLPVELLGYLTPKQLELYTAAILDVGLIAKNWTFDKYAENFRITFAIVPAKDITHHARRLVAHIQNFWQYELEFLNKVLVEHVYYLFNISTPGRPFVITFAQDRSTVSASVQAPCYISSNVERFFRDSIDRATASITEFQAAGNSLMELGQVAVHILLEPIQTTPNIVAWNQFLYERQSSILHHTLVNESIGILDGEATEDIFSNEFSIGIFDPSMPQLLSSPPSGVNVDWSSRLAEALYDLLTTRNSASSIYQVVPVPKDSRLLKLRPATQPLPAQEFGQFKRLSHWQNEWPTLIDQVMALCIARRSPSLTITDAPWAYEWPLPHCLRQSSTRPLVPDSIPFSRRSKKTAEIYQPLCPSP